MEENFKGVSVVLKRYRVGNREIRVHHRSDNNDVVQAWLLTDGILTDTALSIDKAKRAKILNWFFEA